MYKYGNNNNKILIQLCGENAQMVSCCTSKYNNINEWVYVFYVCGSVYVWVRIYVCILSIVVCLLCAVCLHWCD